MATNNLVIYDEDFTRINAVLGKLCNDAKGKAVFLGEREFSILFHEGERDNLHISVVASMVILVVIFDNRSSLGLVRLRVKRASEDLGTIFRDLTTRREREAGQLRAAF